jgi:hypothetical protein
MAIPFWTTVTATIANDQVEILRSFRSTSFIRPVRKWLEAVAVNPLAMLAPLLHAMVTNGCLEKTGNGRGTRYNLPTQVR